MAKRLTLKPAPAAFKIEGEFVRQTFIREYKQKGNSEAVAVEHFDNLLQSGDIVKIRHRNEVCIFQFKKAQ